MSKKVLLLTGIALLVVALGNLFPTPVHAQCGTWPVGSCVTCHIEQAPVYDEGHWHSVHARRDCCTNCHGGNCSATEKELAHVGLIANPLEDVYTNCHACHPDDYWQRAEVFAAELDITPASRSTPTPVATSDPASRRPQIDILPPPGPPPLISTQQALMFFSAGLTAAIVLLVLGFLVHHSVH
jgi:hypothetical protein